MKVEVTHSDMNYTTPISLIGGGAAAQIVPHHSFLPFQPPLSPTLLLICLLQGQFNLNLESYMYSQAPSQC